MDMLGLGRGVSMPAQRFTASSHWFQHDFGWAQERFCRIISTPPKCLESRSLKFMEIPSHLAMKTTSCYLVVFFTYCQQPLQDLCRCLPTISNGPPPRAEWKIGKQVESSRILLFHKGTPRRSVVLRSKLPRCWDLLGLDICCRDVGDDGASALATNLPKGEDFV